MNRHSILTKTTIFFIILFICVNSILYVYIVYLKDNAITLQGQKYFELIKIIRTNPMENEDFFENIVEQFNVKIIKDKDLKKEILSSKAILKDKVFGIHSYKGETYLKFIKIERGLRNRFKDFKNNPQYLKFLRKNNNNKREALKKFLVKNRILLLPNKNSREYFVFRDDSIETKLLNKIHSYTIVFVIVIDILLISFYIFLYRKIKPLNSLKDKIKKFAQGDLSVRTKMKGKDEISEVANEFNYAIIRINDLKDSRNLFLRNIMHELKTPITKGKLISDTLDDQRKKEIMQRVFYRLEYLLGEFTKIEKLTSGKLKLKKNNFALLDLVHQAMDILMLDDTKLDIKYNTHFVDVDFDFFSIALKNLIDNAIKYNTNGNPKIIIENNKVKIINQGKILKKPIEEYLKPFNREYESIDKGLGLGLYISNSIIKAHGFTLDYYYNEGHHTFTIELSS